jgi:hypothetical protein
VVDLRQEVTGPPDGRADSPRERRLAAIIILVSRRNADGAINPYRRASVTALATLRASSGSPIGIIQSTGDPLAAAVRDDRHADGVAMHAHWLQNRAHSRGGLRTAARIVARSA